MYYLEVSLFDSNDDDAKIVNRSPAEYLTISGGILFFFLVFIMKHQIVFDKEKCR